MGITAVAVPGIAVALVLSGCDDGNGGTEPQPSGRTSTTATQPTVPAPPTPTTSSGSSQPSAKTALTITLHPSSTSPAKTWTLTCDPTGGDLPKAKDACAALAKAAAADKDPFAPTPKDRMCTQIYGGPETATVKGTWNGKKVDSMFSRKNGCELKRWSDVASLFGPVPPIR